MKGKGRPPVTEERRRAVRAQVMLTQREYDKLLRRSKTGVSDTIRNALRKEGLI